MVKNDACNSGMFQRKIHMGGNVSQKNNAQSIKLPLPACPILIRNRWHQDAQSKKPTGTHLSMRL